MEYFHLMCGRRRGRFIIVDASAYLHVPGLIELIRYLAPNVIVP